jgi:hypothetical protein
MKKQKPNAEHLWKELEDHLIPQLRLSITDRVIYFRLLRHSHLEGKPRLQCLISGLSRGAGLTLPPSLIGSGARAAKGILRLLERNRKGHLLEVRLPAQIRLPQAYLTVPSLHAREQ